LLRKAKLKLRIAVPVTANECAEPLSAAVGDWAGAVRKPGAMLVDVYEQIERVVDLTDPALNHLYDMSAEAARALLLEGPAERVSGIHGSFALVAKRGRTVRMARSLDRPLRYFLAKRKDGPALIVSDRIDSIHEWLVGEGLAGQFRPNYTRMVPAHYVVELELVGCPDPDPVYERFFAPPAGKLPADREAIGRAYISAVADEIAQWLRSIPADQPLGVCFSGGIDSGSVFLVTHHVMRKLGMSPARLKAFVLDLGDGPDVHQARTFLEPLGLSLFLEPIEGDAAALDVTETIGVVEDYKPLDVESATMALALAKGIRARYPDWRYLIDGDGGDENLKDYPIEANPELTIRSVINNPLLYQEGWGVGKIKHSLTYSGGLSRSYVRTYATARRFGFSGFSPYTMPGVIRVAEAIPFIELTNYDVDRLYALKGEVVARGVEAVTGMKMPVFSKRRFQHGALTEDALRRHLPYRESEYRNQFLSLYQ
jgi:asparagine synthase (glutamine-hydrolysing)